MRYGHKIEGLPAEVVNYDSLTVTTVYRQELSPETVALYLEHAEHRSDLSIEKMVEIFGNQMKNAIRAVKNRYSRIEITIMHTRSTVDTLFTNAMFDAGMALSTRQGFFGKHMDALTFTYVSWE